MLFFLHFCVFLKRDNLRKALILEIIKNNTHHQIQPTNVSVSSFLRLCVTSITHEVGDEVSLKSAYADKKGGDANAGIWKKACTERLIYAVFSLRIQAGMLHRLNNCNKNMKN